MRITSGGLILLAAAATPVLAQTITPGQWQITSTVQSIDMPGVPPQIAAQMKARPTVITQCITPQQAAAGPREMLKQAKGCTVSRYAVVGTSVDAVIVCKQAGGTVTASSKGSFTPTSFTTTGTTVMTGGQKMTMKATTSGKRIGACR